ncbi:MAG: type II and III secretion system protein family protein [Candidatus Longimicrobiales bacterium M2_2A_002]
MSIRRTLHRLSWLLAVLLASSAPLTAQQVLTEAGEVVSLGRGTSALITTLQPVEKVALGDPEIADAVVISPTEVVINSLTVGTTSLFVWDEYDQVDLYTVVVTPDIGSIERQINALFPDLDVQLSATGGSVVVSGTVREALAARRILEIVEASGATVINNMMAPSALQVMLHVRFAEVARNAVKALGSDLVMSNVQDYEDVDKPADIDINTFADGVVELFLLGDNGTGLDAFIRALRSRGEFRSLAEPNLVTLEGQEATFLAGGEFPFPSVQGGQNNQVTIQWKEFGVRLNFTPYVTNDGRIRLSLAPEVSSLDFGNGLTFAGFTIPTLLTRRTSTDVELMPGQHLAIAGLLDNQQEETVDKIPLLGHLPIIGSFFSYSETRDRQTELLVIVTPHIVEPTDTRPAVPTGEPVEWDRSDMLNDSTSVFESGRRLVDPERNQGG